MNLESFIGTTTGPRKMEYTWRDVALYALAVGARQQDLRYYYEQDMVALPTFGVLPYWNAVGVSPQRPVPHPASVIVLNAIGKHLGEQPGGLHMEHEIVLHRPIDPIKGSFVSEDTVTDIYDRGEGKGIVVRTEVPVHDEAGNLVCTNRSSTAIFALGGFGGPRPPANPVTIPDRAPDVVVADFVTPTQHALYRLTGDTNHIHVNPDVAQAAGFDRPFLQGLCSFGFAGRLAVEAFIPGQPERMTKFAAQMRSVCYPGTDVLFKGWQVDNAVWFRLEDAATGSPVLDRGVFEFRN